MTRPAFLVLPALLALLSCQPHRVAVAEPIDDKEFAALLAAIRPNANEDEFDKIPWLTSIWEARAVAAKENKPILLWEMDGHPLGCG